jgi:type 1 glutamine amidotransferase
MSPEGKELFLKSIESGKVGIIGFHCASDTFHSKNRNNPDLLRDASVKGPVDPYIGMIGGEFAGHGRQQDATMKFVSKEFPGLSELKDFTMHEEWYNLKNLAPDMHVILVQDTNSMKNPEPMYKRNPFPATWARMHGKGRVFYTSMGHKPEVWKDSIFQKVVVAGLDWTSGKTQFDPKPNLERTAPQTPTQSAVAR